MAKELSKAERELVIQVTGGNVAVTAERLAKGASANTIGWKDNPVLVTAVEKQDLEMVQLLLDHGADVWAVGFINTAVEAAVSRPSLAITAALLNHATPLNDQTTLRAFGFFRTPQTAEQKRQCILAQALKDGQTEQVEFLESTGFAILDRATTGRRALYDAAHRRDWRTCAFLHKRGVEPLRGLWLVPEAARALTGAGVTNPIAAVGWEMTLNALAPMTPAHPLYQCAKTFAALEERSIAFTRPATGEEVFSLATLGLHGTIVEFYAHLMPAAHGHLPLHLFPDLMVENVDSWPLCLRSGYFIIGSDISGDWYAFGPEPLDERPTPPIFRFDHERWPYTDPTVEAIRALAEQVAGDMTQFARSFLAYVA